MTWIAHQCKPLVRVSILVGLLALVACDGNEHRDRVDSTVERLSGKDQIEQMKKMKVDIDKIKEMQAQRLKPPQ